jgi:hypothetical protein
MAFTSIPVVEVRDEGIDAQLGMLGANEHIRYDEAHRDKCLVEIAQAICRIRERVSQTTFRLEPSEFTSWLVRSCMLAILFLRIVSCTLETVGRADRAPAPPR